MDGTNPSQWLPGLHWDLQRPATAISTTLANMTALTAMRTVPSIYCVSMENLTGLARFSICPKVPVTAVKMQTRCNVNCQLAEGRRQNHTPSITFHWAGPWGLLKKPPGTEKESLFGSPPVGSGLPSGRAARAARSKKRRVHLRRGTSLTCQKRTSRPFFSLRPLPAVIVPYFPRSLVAANR